MNETWAEEEGLGMNRVEVKQSHNMMDKETQIYNNDPHLFVFDDEVIITIFIIWCIIVSSFQVEIVLESIIGRTVEQSMLEVQQEEEILRARWRKIWYFFC